MPPTILLCRRLYRAVAEQLQEGYILLRLYRATAGWIHIQTHRLMRRVYQVRR
jgi:hypothetical protein